mgnify:FL=1
MVAAIYAVVSEFGFFVKRLNPGPEGIEVVSDNKAYGPLTIRPDAMHGFHILGRVVWVGHLY